MMNSKHLISTFAVEASTSIDVFGVFVFLVFRIFLGRKRIYVFVCLIKILSLSCPHSQSLRQIKQKLKMEGKKVYPLSP